MNDFGRSAFGDQGDGTYRNPILYADFSDPDVVGVGDDYYLTASSFNCIPGLPILHSRDLVNWRLIGHALERYPHADYDRPQHGKGVWAPAIRHHEGRFWIFFGAPDEGIYMTTADAAAGPWSQPHLVRAGKGLIDPCPFWDDDGQGWLIRAQAASRCEGVNSLLTLHRMDPAGTRLLDDGCVVIDGRFRHPIVEGPKLYKRNGWYYIFAPAGGVKGGWQTVFRARSIEGPYEDRVVLMQGNSPINGPHQGAWVETPAGEHWFLHFQDRGAAGRILHLQPVEWRDDWPLVGEATRARDVYEPVLQHRMPKRTGEDALPEAVNGSLILASSGSAGARIGLDWSWMANPQKRWHAVEHDRLRLFCQGTPDGRGQWFEAGNLLGMRPRSPDYRVTVLIDLASVSEGDRAGMVLTGGRSGSLMLRKAASGFELVFSILSAPDQPLPETVATVRWDQAVVCLRLEMVEGNGLFGFAGLDDRFQAIGKPIRPTDAAWMGARIGILALSAGDAPSGGSALFSNFNYEPL